MRKAFLALLLLMASHFAVQACEDDRSYRDHAGTKQDACRDHAGTKRC